MDKKIKRYNRGSEWRKWDLHFHAPSKFTCAKNDQYEGSNLKEKQSIFLEELEAVNDIAVIGITDYFSLDGYKFVIENFENPEKFELILPNIEMRISPVTSSNRKINIHIIPNTEVLEIDDIERFLYKFEIGRENYTCKEEDLILFGQEIDPNLSREKAFKRGLNEFSISYDRFFEVYNQASEKIKNNILIGVSNDSLDGMSGIKDIQGIRNIIYSGAHFIFSANPKDKEYFVGNATDNKEEISRKYGKLLPCFHGSDYHGSKGGREICVPDENRFCWVKADPSFEGLKQVLYEPEDRVFIQSNKPEDKSGYQVIDRLEIKSALIFNEVLQLNENLNSIIGSRSSGKSVLLGAIAKKLQTSRKNKFDNPDYDAFVQSISNDLKVIWKDGKENNNREVEFFEQGYMYKIARDPIQFNQIVQDILQQKGKESLLIDYRIFKLNNSQKLSNLISKYFYLIREIDEDKRKARDIGDKEGIEQEINKLQSKREKLSETDITKKELQKFSELQRFIKEMENEVELHSRDISAMKNLEYSNIINLDLGQQAIYFSNSGLERIENFLTEIGTKIKLEWEGGLTSMKNKLENRVNSLNKQIKIFKNDRIYLIVKASYEANVQLQEIESKITEQKSRLQKIEAILSNIVNLETQISEIENRIFQYHKGYYSKCIDISSGIAEEEESLRIIAKIKFNQDEYSAILNSALNLQSSENQELCNYIFNDDIDSYLEHQKIIFKKLIKNALKLKSGYDNESLAHKLLSNNFFNLNYDIEYEGDNFNKMSDGKKAFVVLKLLLDFSDKDCPILIDQPEDDLDNRAIYNDLVQYFIRKKKKRQIIVATHNPNIVVGADSELIICANQNGEGSPNKQGFKFQYNNGSLEHSFFLDNSIEDVLSQQGTREHVCDILEGGNTAFKLREKKYAIEV